MRGQTRLPEYRIWINMRQRCLSPKHPGYERYGGRGIRICARWDVFENFYLDMGRRPAGLSIDRINNNGNYEPGNCRWATQKQQAMNTSRTSGRPNKVLLSFRIHEQTMQEIHRVMQDNMMTLTEVSEWLVERSLAQYRRAQK